MSEKLEKYENGGQLIEKYCRICLDDQGVLVKLPCHCKGSLSYMHDSCLTNMLKVKQQLQKQDVQDYVKILHQNQSSDELRAKCEICLHQIPLQMQESICWQKLMDVQLEVYFVLAGISAISIYGVNIAIKLLEKAIEETGFFSKGLYIGAYFWIVGVILYVIFEPIYSELKLTKYRISNHLNRNTSSKPKNINAKLKPFLKKLLNFYQSLHENAENSSSNRKWHQSARNSNRVKFRSQSKKTQRNCDWEIQIKPKYYQI